MGEIRPVEGCPVVVEQPRFLGMKKGACKLQVYNVYIKLEN